MAGKVAQFFSHIVPAILRPLRVLWNEIVGFVFLVLAVWSAPSSFRAYQEYAQTGETDSLFRIILAGLFALLMGFFGVTSFLRARKISRS